MVIIEKSIKCVAIVGSFPIQHKRVDVWCVENKKISDTEVTIGKWNKFTKL